MRNHMKREQADPCQDAESHSASTGRAWHSRAPFGKESSSHRAWAWKGNLWPQSGRLCLVLLMVLSWAPLAHAATFTVTITNDSGAGSFRQALTEANLLSDTDTIIFNIPGPGPHTIRPSSALPTIVNPVIIDGYSQQGAVSNSLPVGNNAVLKLRLSGVSAGAGVNGLAFNRSGCSVQGLDIIEWTGYGIRLIGTSDTTIQGNFIGLDVDGVTVAANALNGIRSTAVAALIGGLDPGQRNLISGNGGGGIELFNSADNVVQGNYIGTDASGLLSRGNGGAAIALFNPNSTRNIIGGTNSAARNVIAGSTGTGASGNHGFFLNGCNSNTILGNFIGTDVTGTNGLGNGGAGVYLTNSLNNVIGGTGTGAGNVIAFNVAAGVRTPGGTNAFYGNSIFSNGALGIDLGTVGITANDAGDVDTGANNLQNYPVISVAVLSGGTITLQGNLNSKASTAYRLEFFSSPACDASGSGEGAHFLGSTNVATDPANNASFTLSFSSANAADTAVTATATAPDGSTSEFSACYGMTIGSAFAVTNLNDSGAGSLRQALLAANLDPDLNTISLNVPGPGPFSIALASALPVITAPVIIDATTQPGFSNKPIVELNGSGVTEDGLVITAGGSTVRGLVLNQFSGSGLRLESGGSNLIEGNFVGTALDGMTDLGNGRHGILITNSAGNIIGGTNALARNVLSQNTADGVRVAGSAGSNNWILGNFIGTDWTGMIGAGNRGHGVTISNASANVVGGTLSGWGNVISWQTNDGVHISGTNTVGNLVLGNMIGTDVTGTNVLGNGGAGVRVDGGTNHVIGGVSSGSGNIIADSSQAGVAVVSGHCAIQGNVIHSNGGLSIDLNNNGATPNDAGDPDSGPNNLQNYPILTAVTNNGFHTAVHGTLNSSPNRGFWLEFFAAPTALCGEAHTFLGAGPASADGSGNATFSFLFATGPLTSQSVTATATDPFKSSSELSACLTVVVDGTPAIVSPPEDQLIPVRGDATFHVVASGQATLAYQWRFNGVDIPGATSSELFLRDIQPGWAGSYSVRVTNSAGSMVSANATLFVLPPELPAITTQPQSQTLALGASTLLNVGYSGSGPFSFQWRLVGVNIPNATNSTYAIVNAQAAHGGTYTVVVITPTQSLESTVAIVLIDLPVSPLTDDFEDRNILNSASGQARARSVDATRQLNEPLHGTLSSKSLWIGWQAPGNGVATFSTAGSGFDTLLAVYTGSVLDTLAVVDQDDDRNGFGRSRVLFNTQAGTVYQIVVDGFNGASGHVVLSWDWASSSALLPVLQSPPPRKQISPSGSTVLLSVGYTTQDPVELQWLLNGQEISGATSSTFQIDNLQAGVVGFYALRLRTAAREIITLPADLQISSGTDTNAAAHDKLADLIRPAPLPPPPRFAARALSQASAGPARADSPPRKSSVRLAPPRRSASRIIAASRAALPSGTSIKPRAVTRSASIPTAATLTPCWPFTPARAPTLPAWWKRRVTMTAAWTAKTVPCDSTPPRELFTISPLTAWAESAARSC